MMFGFEHQMASQKKREEMFSYLRDCLEQRLDVDVSLLWRFCGDPKTKNSASLC
jgi:hypothetical protein